MSKPVRIVAYMPSFETGGVQRLMLLLMEYLAKQGFSVAMVVHQASGEMLGLLPPEVELIDLRVPRTLRAIPRLAAWMRQEQPDVLISCLGHNNIAAICARFLSRASTAVVISQHNALTLESRALRHWQHQILPFMYRHVGGYADAIIAVSDGVARDMSDSTGLSSGRITVIPNPVIGASFADNASLPVSHAWLDAPDSPVFVAVGRLVPQKDLITLLTAFAHIHTRCAARLLIIGEGPERTSIEQKARELGIADKVQLIGYCDNPLPYIRKSAALVLSSQYEGFGNVIVEALACGTSVVSTDCPFGPAEVLSDGRYGRLVKVGDSQSMGQAMLDVLDKPFAPELLKARASEYTVERIGRQYIDLFYSVLQRFQAGKVNRRNA